MESSDGFSEKTPMPILSVGIIKVELVSVFDKQDCLCLTLDLPEPDKPDEKLKCVIYPIDDPIGYSKKFFGMVPIERHIED